MLYVADWIKYFITVGRGYYVKPEDRERVRQEDEKDAKLLIINISDVRWWMMVVLNYIKRTTAKIITSYNPITHMFAIN